MRRRGGKKPCLARSRCSGNQGMRSQWMEGEIMSVGMASAKVSSEKGRGGRE